MTCAVSGCTDPAAAAHTWGLYPRGDRNKDVPLCESHGAELWAEIKAPVAALLMHYECKPVTAGA
jgi:hypothetical protein